MRPLALVSSSFLGACLWIPEPEAGGDVPGVETGPADTASLVDADGDGYSPAEGDCDDGNGAVNPTATDVVGDGVDQNCDEADGVDADGDAHAAAWSGGDDCDDVSNCAFPGAAANDSPSDCMQDCDGDDFGSSAPTATGAATGTDCDDTRQSVSPAGDEVPGDEVDEDCDGFYGRTVELGSATARLTGEGASDGAGWAVATGEMDADGADDLLVGAIQDGEGGTNAGAVWAYLARRRDGRACRTSRPESWWGGIPRAWDAGSQRAISMRMGSMTSSPVASHRPASRLERSARTPPSTRRSLPGDTDGGTYAGAVIVMEGPFAGALAADRPRAKLSGGRSENFGAAIWGGDMNGDGLGDVVAGAPKASVYQGTVRVFHGPLSGDLDKSEADAELIGVGQDLAGASIFAADVDGDGTLDAILGAPGHYDGNLTAGAGYVVMGSSAP